MTGHRWQDLVPSAVLALGIVAAQAARSAWHDVAAMAVLAFALLAADALSLRLRGGSLRPSQASWVLAAGFVLAGALAALRAPGHDGSLITVFGLGAWAVFFSGGPRRRAPCPLTRSS